MTSSISMIGLAASPGTDVLPACSMASANAPTCSRSSRSILEKRRGHSGSYSETRTSVGVFGLVATMAWARLARDGSSRHRHKPRSIGLPFRYPDKTSDTNMPELSIRSLPSISLPSLNYFGSKTRAADVISKLHTHYSRLASLAHHPALSIEILQHART